MSFGDVFYGWLAGKKRRSRHLSDNQIPFATRKERRMHDRKFLKPRERKRVVRIVDGEQVKSRRAKSLRLIDNGDGTIR